VDPLLVLSCRLRSNAIDERNISRPNAKQRESLLFLRILEAVRCRYRFLVIGYVVMRLRNERPAIPPFAARQPQTRRVLAQRVGDPTRCFLLAGLLVPRGWATRPEGAGSRA